jgi:hypothetical protein
MKNYIMKEKFCEVSYCLSDLCALLFNYFENKEGILLSIDTIINNIIKKNKQGEEIDLKLKKSIKIKIKIIVNIYSELDLCNYNKYKDVVIWNGLDMVSKKLNLIKSENINKEKNKSLLEIIFKIFIKKLILKGKINFDEIIEDIKKLFGNEKIYSNNNLSRRLYDIKNILSTIGIIIYNKKQIIMPEGVIKNYKEYNKNLIKIKLKKKRKSPIKNEKLKKKIKIKDAKLLLQFSKN